MDETEIKHVVEAALLAAGRPLTLDRLGELFSAKGSEVDRATLRRVLEVLAEDYAARGIELKEVASGYRIQIRGSMSDWLTPLWEERAPRYTRALLETLALIAYRQPITRGEIEEVRGVVVSTNIVRTLLERGWVRVVGHRDVPGKPEMFGTTREFLDYFGLKRLEDLPTLVEIKDGLPELSPQTDLVDSLAADVFLPESADGEAIATVGDPDEQTDADATTRVEEPAVEPTLPTPAAEVGELESLGEPDASDESEPEELAAVEAEEAELEVSVIARFEDPQIEDTGLVEPDEPETEDDAVVVPLRKAQGTADGYE